MLPILPPNPPHFREGGADRRGEKQREERIRRRGRSFFSNLLDAPHPANAVATFYAGRGMGARHGVGEGAGRRIGRVDWTRESCAAGPPPVESGHGCCSQRRSPCADARPSASRERRAFEAPTSEVASLWLRLVPPRRSVTHSANTDDEFEVTRTAAIGGEQRCHRCHHGREKNGSIMRMLWPAETVLN